MKRLSVNINDESADALRRCMAMRDYNLTEAIRRAIALLDWAEARRAAAQRGEQS